MRLEAHRPAGELPTIRAIMDQVTQPCVRVKLNSDRRDNQGQGFEYNFKLVKKYLGKTLHVHDLKDAEFPNQLQIDLLLKMSWDGWFLLESSDKEPRSRRGPAAAARTLGEDGGPGHEMTVEPHG